MKSFHTILPSNCSMRTYPDNTLNHYVTALSNQIELNGDWEVALSEILFQRTWYNIQKDEYMLSIITPGNEIDMFLPDSKLKPRNLQQHCITRTLPAAWIVLTRTTLTQARGTTDCRNGPRLRTEVSSSTCLVALIRIFCSKIDTCWMKSMSKSVSWETRISFVSCLTKRTLAIKSSSSAQSC